MRRGVVAALVVGAVVAARTPGRAQEQPRALTGFAVLGLESITLRSGVEI